MLFLFLIVPILLMVVAFWDWRRLNKAEASIERPDYGLIAKLEQELGLISALSEEQFDREIDKVAPVAQDPLVGFMTSTYERAVLHAITGAPVKCLVNTDPNKSILTEMFKVD